jgi:hypothetical protein
MAGFTTDARGQDTMYADNVDFSGAANPQGQFTANGQLLIGSAIAPNIRISTLTAGSGVSITNGAGSITIGLATSGVVTSITAGANINITGTANVPIVNLNTQILQPNGSVSAPSYSFATETGSGMWQNGTNLSFAWQGTEYIRLQFGGTNFLQNIIAAAPLQLYNTLNLTYNAPASWPYTASSDIFISVDSSSARTVNLPNAPSFTGTIYIVKDRVGSAGTHNITVTTPGGTVTFDGSTTYVIDTNYGAAQFIFNGTNYEVF